ncbi:transcriptional regulator [Ideonella paludis]|uniref:Helix-turn-helix domain-containing protein n=1 Tax=Ideonella paludis TaxID=1233411 RepID=A0ABS5DU18_9BURK|nr:YdaS family helix-turn-helix protein [Ideonella paludis]MBQ0934632.1 helix-turn-helix domain-containing protein [Ideonella paludis]
MSLIDYLNGERGRGRAVAKAAGLSTSFLSQLARGKRPIPAEHCAPIERATGFAVMRWHMRPHDWHRVWPELLHSPGAPEPGTQGDDGCGSRPTD